VLEIQPVSLHQRVALILGSQAEVHLAEQIIGEKQFQMVESETAGSTRG